MCIIPPNTFYSLYFVITSPTYQPHCSNSTREVSPLKIPSPSCAAARVSPPTVPPTQRCCRERNKHWPPIDGVLGVLALSGRCVPVEMERPPAPQLRVRGANNFPSVKRWKLADLPRRRALCNTDRQPLNAVEIRYP